MINICHKDMTDEECYENIKHLYEQDPHTFMAPEVWRKKRLVVLEEERKIWSK